jgi:hypothetical protein
MNLYRYLLSAIIMLLGHALLFAQNEQLRTASIPIQLIKDNKHICFKGKINNSDLVFYFDTGASTSLLDKASAKKSGILPNTEQLIDGAGGTVKYEMALNQTVEINDIRLDAVDVVLENLTRLKKQLGYDFDGIIGYSLLKNYISEIDPDNKVINLYPRYAKLDYTGYSKHSFAFDNNINIPQLEVEIELKNNEKLKGKIFLDSGAGLTLLINTPFKVENELEKKSTKILTTSTENLSKKSTNQQIALKSLTFAGYTFYDLPVGLASDNAGVSSYKGYLGILGSEIINRFNMILDYDAKTLYLKPNKLYTIPFNIPLTGFTLKTNEQNQVVVAKISEESPAYQYGMREGDQILAINNIQQPGLEKCNELLKKEGEKMKLTVKNEQGTKTYTLILSKLL